ncbi:MAG: 1-(5-phosphoribosyl)-5-[(5-phosphoribosylamino)methylideneamino]imidazole-4-carboxamide isomerase [Proteobacteria bacterium]|nr:1-(5-phosphoribosyl)-5-[(5-phosphoribosylamino)methylideneamino]imidazole-4-carboxamide isomerase [Pseudomonadota bacterium]MBU1741918.1 1-(5-phosphoribosyl)-5-[(5-phosphoribosylamino)methylideneamino]imidazole-4-carboxamide isomerase [Pseudomonadota bacterium]
MRVIPAIDLKGGQCVRLLQGDMDRVSVFGDDPVAMARRWEAAGAELLHVVDLDAAVLGRVVHGEVIGRMAGAVSIPVQVGGGVRDMASLDRYLDLGVARVILGTAALRDPEFLRLAAAGHPGRVIVGVDARNSRVAVQGWTEATDRDVIDVAAGLRTLDLAALIYTDIGRDGMQTGTDRDGARRLLEVVEAPLIVAGGVSTLDDIRGLKPLAEAGLWGVITGRALYAGSLDLGAALAEVSGWNFPGEKG